MGTKTVSWCDRCGEEKETRNIMLVGRPGGPAILDSYDLCDDCLTELFRQFDEFAKYKNTLGK